MLRNSKKWLLITVILLFSALIFADGYLGVFLRELNSKEYENLNLANYGLYITDLSETGPAKLAELKVGDILLELDKEKIYTINQLTKMLKSRKAGEKVKVELLRGEKSITKRIKLGSHEDLYPKRAYLGIIVGTLTKSLKTEFNYNNNHGIILSTIIEDSPAFKAGLKPNDILMELDGEKLYTVNQLTAMLKNYKPKDIIKIVAFNDEGKSKTYKVTLGEHEDNGNNNMFFNNDWFNDIKTKTFMFKYDSENDQVIGVKIVSSKTNEKDSGLVIEEVIADSPADMAGLKTDDVILSVNGKEAKTVDGFIDEIQNYSVGDKVKIKVLRDSKKKEFEVEIGKRESIFKHEHKFDNMDFDIDIDLDDILDKFDFKKFQKDGIKVIENIQQHFEQINL